MKRSQHFSAAALQRGMSLVELLVGLTIGLVLALAATSLYMATSESTRASKAQTDINETGKLALDMIGRELQKAGFYPAQFPSNATTPNAIGAFFNGKAGAKVTFNSGVFGCDGANYNVSTQLCATKVDGAPDSIIINYFATPEFGASSLMGNSNDCNRRAVSDDTDNTARAAANLPLFVSNRYGLAASTYADPNGNTLSTMSLGCHGNGSDAATAMELHLQGITDLVIRYGVYSTTTAQSPDKFLTAAEVSDEPALGDVPAWRRVTSVNVCMVVRSLENGRQEDKTGSVRTYRNCRGQDITLPSTNRIIYKRFERVFAVRNNLTGTL